MLKRSSHFAIGYERCQQLHRDFVRRVKDRDLPCASAQSIGSLGLSAEAVVGCFRSQLLSRHLDYIARRLKQENKSFYTIASAGHEFSAAIALAFRHNDMAFLHYRSGAFMLQRAQCRPTLNMVKAILASMIAAKIDPVAEGRHKVFGSVELFVPPQTSTIASHLPKAVGMASSIKRAQTLKVDAVVPYDSVVLCSFGDASVNHASSLCALNAAEWMVRHHYPLPIVFICEDNGLGVSVKTPHDWIEQQYSNKPHFHYIQADGSDFLSVYAASKQAETVARAQKKPVFLHIRCVRLLGHAGVDFEPDYRSLDDISSAEARDPLFFSASTLLENGCMSVEELLALDRSVEDEVEGNWMQLKAESSGLATASDVMKSICPIKNPQSMSPIPVPLDPTLNSEEATENKRKPLDMASQLNACLTEMLTCYRHVIVFGEDVGKKGGVYKITKGLQQRFGSARVFDTLLDETTILGHAIGHAHNGFIPIPEIQFLAYFHNAEDQLRGEAATLSFFSSGQFSNPMVIRIASFAYQKGFGGHFHNDNSISVFRDIPGIIVACPSNGLDAAKMLRQCVQLAYVERRIVVFLEPIALYRQKDLHEPGDRLWLSPFSDVNEQIRLGELGVRGDGGDLAILSYGYGFFYSCKAEKILADYGVSVKLIDLRWLAPIDYLALEKEIGDIRCVLIVDECRQSGALSEALIANLHSLQGKSFARVTAEDCFITLGESWKTLLPDEHQIVTAAKALLQSTR